MPIMSEEWIFRCWDYRDETAVSANDEHLVMNLILQLFVQRFDAVGWAIGRAHCM